jgi:hypothetical protein
MANPRNIKAYENIGQEIVTVAYDSTITYDATKSNGSASVGLAVTFVSQGTVGLTQDGDMVAGKLIRVNDDSTCSIQIEGGMTLPGGVSATLTAGSPIVGALGAASAKGYIRSVAATTGSYVQATATETQKARGIILDSSTTTAVAVWLS